MLSWILAITEDFPSRTCFFYSMLDQSFIMPSSISYKTKGTYVQAYKEKAQAASYQVLITSWPEVKILKSNQLCMVTTINASLATNDFTLIQYFMLSLRG